MSLTQICTACRLITSSRQTLIMAKKNQNSILSLILLYGRDILILPCGPTCILLKFVVHAANNLFMDKFNNGDRLLSMVLLFYNVNPFSTGIDKI